MTLRTHPVTPSGRNPAGRHNPHIRPTHHVRPRHTPPTTSANGPAAPRRNRLSSGRERHPSNRTRVARGRPPHEVTPGEATTHEEAMSLARAPACTRGPDPGRDRAAQGGGPREGAGPTTRERPHDGERPQEVERLHGGEPPGGSRPHDERAPRRVVTARSRTAPRCRPYQGPARSDRSPHDRAARTRPQPARPPDHSPPDDPAPTGPQPTRQPSPHQATSHTRPQVTQGFPCASAQVAACGPATPGASGREHHLRSLYARTTGRGDARGGCMRIRSRNGQRA